MAQVRTQQLGQSMLIAWFIRLFGGVCCTIALAHIAIGPAAIPESIQVNATMDSEDRFYATLFLGFGAALIWCAGDVRQRTRALGWLLLVFCLGGVSRLVSVAMVGPPSPLFQILTATELLLPLILWFWIKSALPARPVPSAK